MGIRISQCAGLTSVNLYGCINITDAGLASLAGGCVGLTSVNLSGWVNITDAGLDDSMIYDIYYL